METDARAPRTACDMNAIVGSHDVALIVFDTLRWDVAARELAAGRTPNLARLVGAWEERLTPACFTYAAHHAFFAGFLPVPVAPGVHPRLFACAFDGSRTIAPTTRVFDAPDIVSGLAGAGYRTVAIGGVGFFNPASPLGRVLPGLFQEAHWDASLGVACRDSAKNAFALAAARLEAIPREQRVFLYVNVAAIHQPNWFYRDAAPSPDGPSDERRDDLESHAAALRHVDAELPRLEQALRRRGKVFAVLCSDHGTAYGEDGYFGHRVPHPVVNAVPYAEVVIEARPR